MNPQTINEEDARWLERGVPWVRRVVRWGGGAGFPYATVVCNRCGSGAEIETSERAYDDNSLSGRGRPVRYAEVRLSTRCFGAGCLLTVAGDARSVDGVEGANRYVLRWANEWLREFIPGSLVASLAGMTCRARR